MKRFLVLYFFLQFFLLNHVIKAVSDEDIFKMQQLNEDDEQAKQHSSENRQERVDSLGEDAKRASQENKEMHDEAERNMERTIRYAEARVEEFDEKVRDLFDIKEDEIEH